MILELTLRSDVKTMKKASTTDFFVIRFCYNIW